MKIWKNVHNVENQDIQLKQGKGGEFIKTSKSIKAFSTYS